MSGVLEIVTLKKTIFLWSCPMDKCEVKGKKKAKSKDSDSMPSEYNRCQEIKARTRWEDRTIMLAYTVHCLVD